MKDIDRIMLRGTLVVLGVYVLWQIVQAAMGGLMRLMGQEGEMVGMFDFVGMLGNYEQRKVDRFEEGGLMVDTCAVTDAEQPFETAVAHPSYNAGRWVIVELYDTKEEAQTGHDRWVATMTADELPSELRDVSTATIAQMCDVAAKSADEDWRTVARQ